MGQGLSTRRGRRRAAADRAHGTPIAGEHRPDAHDGAGESRGRIALRLRAARRVAHALGQGVFRDPTAESRWIDGAGVATRTPGRHAPGRGRPGPRSGHRAVAACRRRRGVTPPPARDVEQRLGGAERGAGAPASRRAGERKAPGAHVPARSSRRCGRSRASRARSVPAGRSAECRRLLRACARAGSRARISAGQAGDHPGGERPSGPRKSDAGSRRGGGCDGAADRRPRDTPGAGHPQA